MVAIFFLTFSFSLYSQVKISGRVTDRKGEILTGVNVYLDGTYSGSTSDNNGNYSFSTILTEESVLIASFVGYKTFSREISGKGNLEINIALKESASSLDAVVITAGTFEASDEKKAVIFKPLDIVTTAGGLADIPSAINTLPGTQTVGEEGKLFVRGGDHYETQTYIDGMIVDKPYESTTPDIPSRGRFSPFLFKGTIFSSGGYSAEYGQALSSALILQTNDMPSESVTSLSFMSVGLGASHTKKWNNTSLALSADYFNLAPYYALVNQNFDWEKAPNGLGSTLVFRQKTDKDGMIKVYGQIGTSQSTLNYPGYANVSKTNTVNLNNDNSYINATYRDLHGEKFISNGGIALTYNFDDLNVSEDVIQENTQSIQYRYNLTYLLSEDVQIKIGGDMWSRNFTQKFRNASNTVDVKSQYQDHIVAGFMEVDWKISRNFAFRAGVRGEYSDYLNKSNYAPRLSLAYKTGKYSQVSFAYGQFYQSPRQEYLLFTRELNFESAHHYILNYQINKNNRTFRIEAYYKDYVDLIKYDSLYLPDPGSYSNTGNGFAKGIDVFWRDNSFSNIDYWISYSYIDTERNYQNFVSTATPYFVSNHNLSVVYKHFIPQISSQLGLTYKFASGRPFYNPENPDFLSDRTQSYNDLSLNFSYLTSIGKHFTIVHFSVGNVFGWDQTFGYRYSLKPNENGNYESYEIKPGAKRFLFLGVFISI